MAHISHSILKYSRIWWSNSVLHRVFRLVTVFLELGSASCFLLSSSDFFCRCRWSNFDLSSNREGTHKFYTEYFYRQFERWPFSDCPSYSDELTPPSEKSSFISAIVVVQSKPHWESDRSRKSDSCSISDLMIVLRRSAKSFWAFSMTV